MKEVMYRLYHGIIVALLCISVVYMVNQHQTNKEQTKIIKMQQLKLHKLDSIQRVADSLSSELFPIEVELNRYQIAYEIFLKRNPDAAYQYGTIISEETE